MAISLIDCELVSLSDNDLICNFECDNIDLNDFFCNDALDYQKQLLGQTLFFRLKDTKEIVCAFTLSNDSIKMENLSGSEKKRIRKDIPHVKSMSSYPATLIGRFGVQTKFEGNGIGSQVMDFIKSICITEDANKCRFLLVDSYNTKEHWVFIVRMNLNCFFPMKKKKWSITKKKN